MNLKIQSHRRKRTGKKEWIVAAGLLLMGCLLRLLFLEALPYGLNQDEASAGYDAWALLNSGIDRHGKSWPVLFISWGSGQNSLMSYLAMPWIALLGLRPLSIRLPNAIAGCVTLIAMWRMASSCRGERFGLAALFLLAVNPWHIMASRWGLESNLLPALLWGACWCLSMAEDHPKALFGAAVCLGLTPYAYGTVYFLLPPLMICVAVHLRKLEEKRLLWGSLALFILLIFPITLCQIMNMLGGNEFQFLGITFPQLTAPRQNDTSILSGGGFGAIRQNITTFLAIIHNGDDHLSYNALPFWQGGILYFFGISLAVLGFIVCFRQRKEHREEWPVMKMGCCTLLCTALIDGNINRLNMVWLPMIYFSAVGAFWMIHQLQLRPILPIAVVAASFIYFCTSYISEFSVPGNFNYFPGLGQAITASEKYSPQKIYISDEVIQPYIFALFYTTPTPDQFMESVEYTDEEHAIRDVTRIEGFEFENSDRADLWILTKEAAAKGEKDVLETFGYFQVCR